MYFGWMFAYMMSTLYCSLYRLRMTRTMKVFFRKIPEKKPRASEKQRKWKFISLNYFDGGKKKEKRIRYDNKMKCLWRRIFFLGKKKYSYACCMDPHRNVSYEKKLFFGWKYVSSMQYNDLFILIFVCFYFYSTNKAAQTEEMQKKAYKF